MNANQILADGGVGATCQSQKEIRQLNRVGVVDRRTWVDAVRDLVTECHGVRQSLHGLRRRAVLPRPRMGDIIQTETIPNESNDVDRIGRIEVPEQTHHIGIQCGPGTERRRGRPKRSNRLPHEFLDIGFPGRDAHYDGGAVQGHETVLPSWVPRPELSVGTMQFIRIVQQFTQMIGIGIRGQVEAPSVVPIVTCRPRATTFPR